DGCRPTAGLPHRCPAQAGEVLVIESLIFQIALFAIVLLALVKPLGAYMARVYEGKSLFGIERALRPVERGIYRLCGVTETDDMSWKTYAVAVLIFNLLGVAVVYVLQRLQQHLPLNPQHIGAVAPDLSFNTAASFAT